MNLIKFIFNSKNSNKEEKNNDSISIQLSGERSQKELQKYIEIAEKTIKEAIDSGYLREEFIPVFSEKIRNISKIGISYYDPFDKTDCLSLIEKKSLNLNTRSKYSRELINGLTEKGILAIRNKDFIKNMFLRNFHQVSNKYTLEEFKQLGIKYVVISDSGDEKDCKFVKHIKKKWSIDEVPELPLTQCSADYCRCSYCIADEEEI